MNTKTRLNGLETLLYASITGQLHYARIPKRTQKIMSYTVYDRVSGEVAVIKEYMTRDAATKSIEDARSICPLSRNLYCMNGDIVIDMRGDRYSVVGHYKNLPSCNR